MRVMRIVLVCLCVAAAAEQVTAQEETARFQRAYERLDEYVAQEMRASNTPGMAVALTTRSALLRVSTYGFADLKARIPVAPQTLFEIGSISKSFTAVLLLQLREEGKFDPQAPITKSLPWFQIPNQHAPITPHHLLTHTAGIPRDRDVVPSSLYQAAGVRELWTGYAPGQRFAYSNIGYQILGYLLEELARQPYAALLRKRIFEPLGMASSEPAITHETRKRLAVGYTPFYDDRPAHPSHSLVEAPWLEYGAGDGSIAATPADLAAYLRMLLNRGAGPNGRIISEESFRLLTQRAIKTQGDDYYGYGLILREDEGRTVVSHAGGMVGYASAMVGDLSDGLGAVVFVNGPGNPGRIARFALRLLRAALHNQELPAPLSEPLTRVTETADYAGTYLAENGKKLTLVSQGDGLLLDYAGEKIPLERRGKDQFFVDHPDFSLFLLRFVREKEKVVEAVHGVDWFARGVFPGRKFDPPNEWLAYPGHYRTQNPWFSNFRIVLRKGQLWLITPAGNEQLLVPMEPGLFQVGEEPSAERLRLETIVNGKALRASLSGVDYFRSFTP